MPKADSKLANVLDRFFQTPATSDGKRTSPSSAPLGGMSAAGSAQLDEEGPAPG